MRADDPFTGEQLVVERGGGVLEVRGWAAGPAGTAPLSLRGVEVELDVARAGSLVAAVVVDPDRAGRALAALLGPGRAAQVLAAGAGSALLAGDDATRTVRPIRRRPSMADHPATRLALLRLELADPDLPPLARAAALAEAAASARLLGGGLGVGGRARRDAAAAADLFAALRPQPGDPELTAACAAAAAVLDEAGDRRRAAVLRSVASRPPEHRVAAAERASMPMAAPAPAAAGGAEVRRRAKVAVTAVPERVPVVDTAGLPRPTVATARWRGGAELEVRLRGVDGAGWWTRATRPDGTPLAVVPVLDGVSRLLLPLPDRAGVLVDVTHRPDVAPPSSARVAVEAALVAGVDACRAHRLGEPWRAAPRWREGAAAWAAGGDDDRAALAAAYADGTATPTQPQRPLLADRLRA